MSGDYATQVANLNLVGARCVLEGGVARADSLGVPVCIAVADRAGNLVAYARMDGAPLLSASLAQDKAYTVAAFNGIATHEWFDLIKDDEPVLHGIVKTDRLVVFGGGAPVWTSAGLVGAVGVSGGSAAQDREIAETAAAAVAS